MAPFPSRVLLALGTATLLTACQVADQGVTRTQSTNPATSGAAGAAGAAASTLVGSTPGSAAAASEGAAGNARMSYATPERRVVREWRTETTPDGRTIRVAYDTEVDAQGLPIGPSKPAKY